MRFIGAALAVTAVVMAGTIPSSSATTAGTAGESFYDALHGWRVAEGLEIEETNDGGATWRRLPLPFDDQVSGVLRTGLRAGLYGSAVTDKVFWTNDGGEHWSYTRSVGGATVGEGPLLVWWRFRNLYRVTPWPVPGRCVNPPSTTSCRVRRSGRLTTARLAAVPIAGVPDGYFAYGALVPGGVVASTAAPSHTDHPRVVVARWLHGLAARPTVWVRLLPEPPDLNLSPVQGVLVDWPALTIFAQHIGEGTTRLVGRWESIDGGRTWRFVASP